MRDTFSFMKEIKGNCNAKWCTIHRHSNRSTSTSWHYCIFSHKGRVLSLNEFTLTKAWENEGEEYAAAGEKMTEEEDIRRMKKWRCNERTVIYNTVYTHSQSKADKDQKRKELKSEGLAGYTTMPSPFFSHTNTWVLHSTQEPQIFF